MREQHLFVRNRDHIVVKRARGNRFGVLFDEDGPLGIEPVQAGDRAAGLFVLASGECAAGAAIDEHFDTRLRHGLRTAACDWPRLRRRNWAARAAWTVK